MKNYLCIFLVIVVCSYSTLSTADNTRQAIQDFISQGTTSQEKFPYPPRLSSEEDFTNWFVDVFIPKHLEYFLPLDRELLIQKTLEARNKAISIGFEHPVSLVHFIEFSFSLGPNFHTYPGFLKYSKARNMSDMKRIDGYYDDITDEEFSTAMWGEYKTHWAVKLLKD